MEYISSVRNPRIVHAARLITRPALRRTENLIVIEGARELLRALASGITPKTLFIEESRLGDREVGDIIQQIGQDSLCYTVSNDAFSRIAYRGAASSVVALADAPQGSFTGVTLSSCPLVLVLESVEKPGNLGAVLRTADAAAADAVIVCDPATDLFNPNVIRSSLGCIFNVPTVVCSIQQAIQWLKENNISIYAAALQTERLYHHPDYTLPTAFVFGTESTGLSEQWRQVADEIIRIPMLGIADSLNVSVSAAVLVYEARRQRGF